MVLDFNKVQSYYMQFYETNCDNEFLSPLVRETPRTSNLLIMIGCKTDEAREFYLRLCIANRYTKRELDHQIGSMLYERTMISREKHKNLLDGNGGLAALRDSYIFEFLDLKVKLVSVAEIKRFSTIDYETYLFRPDNLEYNDLMVIIPPCGKSQA